MKVTHLISGLRGGGAEHLVLELCIQSLKDPGIEMKVISLSLIDDIAYKFGEAGIEIHPHTERRSGWTPFKAFALLVKQKPRLIHAHMFHACMVACLVKLVRPKTKVIFTLHNNHIPEWHRKVGLFFSKPLRSGDIIFPGCVPAWYQKKNAFKIPNGVNTERFQFNSVKPVVFTCIFIGRLEEQKNPLFLIDVVNVLKSRFRFTIKVAGDGPLKNELEEGINRSGISEYFHFLGFGKDIPGELATSHCLLLPSRWEGMPLVILEAGASRVPVIATPVGNIPYIIDDSSGYLGEPGDFPGLLEEVMNNYGDALIRAGNLMKKVLRHYDIRDCYRDHVSVYLKYYGKRNIP